MLITNHVLAGAVTGALCEDRPVHAFVAGFASHVLMDTIPHWGDARLSIDEPEVLRVARTDGTIGLATLLALAAVAPAPRRAVVAGMAGATVLDVDKPSLHFFGRNPLPRWLDRFHKGIQVESRDRLRTELVGGAALGTLAWAVLARRRRLTR